MPAFNAANVLQRAVQSVQAQIYSDWELFIIDDGSSDETLNVAQSIAANDNKITVLSQNQNTGAARARNRGLENAQGRYIAFLDADDEWDPEKLAQQIRFMQKHKAAFSYTRFWRQTGDKRHLVKVPKQVTRDQLLHGNVIGCLTAIYDRKVLGTVEMPELTMRHDFAMWLGILSRVDIAYGLDIPLATYHRTKSSLSSNTRKAFVATWQLYRNYAGLSRWKSTKYLANHLLRRLWRG